MKRASVGRHELFEEGPVDLERDGEERNPEYGLETDEFDPDQAASEPLASCARCEEGPRQLYRCMECAERVCRQCSVGEPADALVLCRACQRRPPPDSALETSRLAFASSPPEDDDTGAPEAEDES